MARILIIDDDEQIREIIFARMEALGHTPCTADTLARGKHHIQTKALDLVFLDVNLPDGNGLDLLDQIRAKADPPLVIIITAFGNTRGAGLAITNGAWDYIEKPFYKENLILQTRQALAYRAEKKKQEKKQVFNPKGMVGKSRAFMDCLEKAAGVAGSSVSVLIQGESGTGKELLARLIHDHSLVKQSDYVVVDCASLPETLMESVLFGHKKGAFTSADTSAAGLIAQANGGTLFLDEIGELPMSAQKTFLRVLEEKKYRPVGDDREMTSRFRLIAATNRDLKTMAASGTFRTDLYHRLTSYVITVPPLRERKEDIKALAQHYTDKFCTEHGLPAKALLPETLGILTQYQWPGNVRELVNVVEGAVLTDPDLELVYPMQLPGELRVAFLEKNIGPKDHPQAGASIPLTAFKPFRAQAIEEIEQAYFRRLMAKCGWDMDRAARLSGLSKNRVYHYIRKLNLKAGN
jgi:two-component system NtrC family response regulator